VLDSRTRSVGRRKDLWRVLVTVRGNGQIVVVGQRMDDVVQAINQLVVIDLVVGGRPRGPRALSVAWSARACGRWSRSSAPPRRSPPVT
jgi:hypothetical protein